jgi:hypothetical protein
MGDPTDAFSISLALVQIKFYHNIGYLALRQPTDLLLLPVVFSWR